MELNSTSRRPRPTPGSVQHKRLGVRMTAKRAMTRQSALFVWLGHDQHAASREEQPLPAGQRSTRVKRLNKKGRIPSRRFLRWSNKDGEANSCQIDEFLCSKTVGVRIRTSLELYPFRLIDLAVYLN